MIKRTLGKTGLLVSELAFGCVEIGMPYGIGAASPGAMPDETEAIRLLQTARGAGINFFDTARMYGVSEAVIGKAFKDCRDQVVIATKCRHFSQGEGALPDYDVLKKIVVSSLQESMNALQTDYIDVFMLHQADERIISDPAVCAVFAELKKAGIIRATGVSAYTPAQTARAIHTGAWDVVQVPFNLLDQQQAALFDQAQAQGVALVIRSVLLRGLLSAHGLQLHPALERVGQHMEGYKTLAREWEITLPALAIRFALSYPQVATVLVGIDRLDYLHESLAAAGGAYLSADRLEQIRSMAYPDPAFIDLPAWDRNGWLN